jgi:putative nucleotidyltransferase with HDIG domain
MKEELSKIFSELLKQMKNQELAKKTIDVWVESAIRGNWKTVDEIRKIPFTLLTETHGIDLIEHTIAVTKGALGLATAMISTYKQMPFEINLDFVISGGILHDVGKLMEIEKDSNGNYKKSFAGKCARHPISGTIVASQLEIPQEIQNIIICHAKEGEGRPQRVEAVLVHQADFATFNPLVMQTKGLLIENK